MPSVANGFAARAICSRRRSRSSEMAFSSRGLALVAVSRSSAADSEASASRFPALSTRRRSSSEVVVWAEPPTATRADQGTGAAGAAAVARRRGGAAVVPAAGGRQTMHRTPPSAHSTNFVPTTKPIARLQPAKHAGDSNKFASNASTVSRRRSASSKSSHSEALALSLGRRSAWSLRAQKSAAAGEFRRPSQRMKSEAGLSMNSRGCLRRNPVLCSSGKTTAMSNFFPALEGMFADPTRTAIGYS
mmetsp:Transcript_45895/g.99060  ORF Transcript_45895/g.99060 Transcript_45895/m.99060 type:complete len:246 (+) Transcript_45895:1188-1925(+)